MKIDGYTKIDWRTAKQLNIKGNDLLIYSLIACLSSSKGGWMQFDYRRMAEIYNITERSAINSVQNLLDKNLIEKKQGRGVNANRYRPVSRGEENSAQAEEVPSKNFSTNTEEISLQSRKKFSATGEESSHKIDKTNFKHKEFNSQNNEDITERGFYDLG